MIALNRGIMVMVIIDASSHRTLPPSMGNSLPITMVGS